MNQFGPGIVIKSVKNKTALYGIKALGTIAKLLKCSSEEARARVHTKELPCYLAFHTVRENLFPSKKGEYSATETARACEIMARHGELLREYGWDVEVTLPPQAKSTDARVKGVAVYIEHGRNILFMGPTGGGKTEIARAACRLSGYDLEKDVAYFSMPTLQPEDFVGIPFPDQQEPEFFRYLRMKGLANKKVLILDELNRAHPKVLNGVMQLLVERRINDQVFPELRSIIAAINPVGDDYVGTEELDRAVVERFDKFIQVDYQPDVQILAQQFAGYDGKVPVPPSSEQIEVARCLVEWWNEDLKSQAQKELVNPRRLEKIGRAWLSGENELGHCYYLAKNTQSAQALPVHMLTRRLESMSVLSLRELLANHKSLHAEFAANLEEPNADTEDKILRFRDLIDYMRRNDMCREMATVAHLVPLISKEFLASFDRDGLKKWIEASISYGGSEATLAAYRDAVEKRLTLSQDEAETVRKAAAEIMQDKAVAV